SVPGCHTLSPCQHRPRCLGSRGKSDSCPDCSNGSARTGIERHGWQNSPSVFVYSSLLAGAHYDELEENLGGLSGPDGEWPVLQCYAISLVQLYGDRFGGYHRRPFLATCHGGLSEVLETTKPHGECQAECRISHQEPFSRSYLKRMVSVPSDFNIHFCLWDAFLE